MKNENYVLLKDLPDCKVGTIVEKIDHYYRYPKNIYVFVGECSEYNHLTAGTVTQSPEWFMKESEYKAQQLAEKEQEGVREPNTKSIKYYKETIKMLREEVSRFKNHPNIHTHKILYERMNIIEKRRYQLESDLMNVYEANARLHDVIHDLKKYSK